MERQNMNDVAEEMDDYEVLPDYFVLENERENSGYSKDGVYFLRFLRAKVTILSSAGAFSCPSRSGTVLPTVFVRCRSLFNNCLSVI